MWVRERFFVVNECLVKVSGIYTHTQIVIMRASLHCFCTPSHSRSSDLDPLTCDDASLNQIRAIDQING